MTHIHIDAHQSSQNGERNLTSLDSRHVTCCLLGIASHDQARASGKNRVCWEMELLKNNREFSTFSAQAVDSCHLVSFFNPGAPQLTIR